MVPASDAKDLGLLMGEMLLSVFRAGGPNDPPADLYFFTLPSHKVQTLSCVSGCSTGRGLPGVHGDPPGTGRAGPCRSHPPTPASERGSRGQPWASGTSLGMGWDVGSQVDLAQWSPWLGREGLGGAGTEVLRHCWGRDWGLGGAGMGSWAIGWVGEALGVGRDISALGAWMLSLRRRVATKEKLRFLLKKMNGVAV